MVSWVNLILARGTTDQEEIIDSALFDLKRTVNHGAK
jgi:hypothetical protein